MTSICHQTLFSGVIRIFGLIADSDWHLYSLPPHSKQCFEVKCVYVRRFSHFVYLMTPCLAISVVCIATHTRLLLAHRRSMGGAYRLLTMNEAAHNQWRWRNLPTYQKRGLKTTSRTQTSTRFFGLSFRMGQYCSLHHITTITASRGSEIIA